MEPMHNSPKFTTTGTDRDVGTVGISVAYIWVIRKHSNTLIFRSVPGTKLEIQVPKFVREI
jgi:hypothetical protein